MVNNKIRDDARGDAVDYIEMFSQQQKTAWF